MRQYYCTTNLLISVFRVDIQVESDFNCFIEICSCSFLNQLDCFYWFVELTSFNKFYCLSVFLTYFCHYNILLMWSNGNSLPPICAYAQVVRLLVNDFNAHAASSTFYHAHTLFYGISIQVRHFQFSNFTNFIATYFCYFITVRYTRTFWDTCSFFQ